MSRFPKVSSLHAATRFLRVSVATALLVFWSSISAEPIASNLTSLNQRLQVKPGFEVERIYDVPREEQGSWVSLAVDEKGRMIASGQYGGLYRITVPSVSGGDEVKVEPIDVPIGQAQGLLCAFGALYVVVNGDAAEGCGLYRITDADGDDAYDTVELLKHFGESTGEHGPHAVLLSPDGNSLYVVSGNFSPMPKNYDASRVPEAWGEDLLLPRVYLRDVWKWAKAPLGWIAKTDPMGERWEIIATGLRNPYDAAFDRRGELLTFDADMERDLKTPWYRPTRVCQVVSGAEFGWRNNSGKWPSYYPDSVPPVVDIGPGSPVGVTFGYGAAFPARYQNALFICDWSYGKLFAVHLTPNGASYNATFEEFITGQPLPLTDILVNPKDKALYFLTGGRKVQSALYRVTYTGDESVAPDQSDDGSRQPDYRLLKRLETFHGPGQADAVETAWPHLGHTDRFVRYAARVAIEHQPAETWQERVFSLEAPIAKIEAAIALARVGDEPMQGRLLELLNGIDWNSLKTPSRLALVRAYALTFARMGEPDSAGRKSVIARFDPLFPTNHPKLDQELCELMVYLQAPSAARKGMALLRSAPTEAEQMGYAKSLRHLEEGWTKELREAYFQWYALASTYKGSNYQRYLKNMKVEAVEKLDEGEKARLHAIINAEPETKSHSETIAALSEIGGRGYYRAWTVDELVEKADEALNEERDLQRGRTMFGAVSCFACHRFGDDGGGVGPNLTGVAGRFGVRDLLEAIIEPSKEISDQYGSLVITLTDGTVMHGRIVEQRDDRVEVNTDLFDPNVRTFVNYNIIESVKQSPTSMMPPGLINILKEDEIMDLLAYMLKGNSHEN